MRWFYPLFAVAVVLMVVSLPLTGISPVFIALGPAFWLVMGNSLRCPRCRKHIHDNGRGYHAPWIKTPERCVGCGRRKDDIWPFQWLLRPERD